MFAEKIPPSASRGKNLLLVYPKFPETFWGMDYALNATGKKSTQPPLGLLTLAAISSDFDYKLVDLNCEDLLDEHLSWADIVCFLRHDSSEK